MTEKQISHVAVVACSTLPSAPDAIVASSPSFSVESSGSSSRTIAGLPTIQLPHGLSEKFKLVLSQRGIPYGVIQYEGHSHAFQVGSKSLNNFIRAAMMEKGGDLRKFDLKEINEALTAYAEMSGMVEPVWYRVAQIDGGIEIDLGNGVRVVIRVGQISILDRGSKTLFYRTSASAPMVTPAQKGDLNLLNKYLNLNDVDRVLFIGWLSYTLAHPKLSSTNYPILVLNGDQGTGKTSLCNNVIYRLIDPNTIGVQLFPGSPKDLSIASQNAHVLCFDNMRAFKHSMADVLCMAATGGSITNRALYTDADLHVHHLHVALVLNGIHQFVNEPDLAQRCLPIRTMTLPEGKRKSEAAMLQELQADLPVIFRGLLDHIAQVLVMLPKAKVTYPQRMIEFVHWLAAMEMVQGIPDGTLQQLYGDALDQGQLDSLMDNLLAASLIHFCDQPNFHQWQGAPAQLLAELNEMSTTGTSFSREWPQNPIALSKRLNGLKASLLTQGIAMDFNRGKERTITIRKLEGAKHA